MNQIRTRSDMLGGVRTQQTSGVGTGVRARCGRPEPGLRDTGRDAPNPIYSDLKSLSHLHFQKERRGDTGQRRPAVST